MDLLASGRDADVFALDAARVLRRYKDDRSAEPEAAVIRAVVDAGYPTPAVLAVDGPDMVLERVSGPTLAEALLAGVEGFRQAHPPVVTASQAGVMLAELHDELHALPWPGEPLLHLDLHPANVILHAERPVVIDWINARPGRPGLDVALTALICAQVALEPAMAGVPLQAEPAVTAAMAELLQAFAAAVSTTYADHLDEAAALRRRDPNLTDSERDKIGAATDLARQAVSHAPS